MPAPRLSLLAPLLRRYFYSGWAFLMPYLFAYLLYYVTGWPVNAAAAAAAGDGSGVIGKRAIEATTHNLSPLASHLGFSFIPCLLYVYWALHVVQAILAGVALWTWLQKVKGERREVIGTKPDSNLQLYPQASDVWPITDTPLPRTSTPSAHGLSKPEPLNVKRSALSVERSPAGADIWPPASGFSSIAIRIAPWALLALLFYIPGVYLEWPSDPWEHLRRINEWRVLDTVGAHSYWTKSAYFIPYSLLSWCIGLRQLFWLDFYYTGICLLLCWQYYRFSRACGLGDRASMVFVIIQALLFGNNIFSFYRYYGISSSIYAQLGAVALTRIFLEWAARGTKLEAETETTGFGSCITEGDELGHRAHRVSGLQNEKRRSVPSEAMSGSKNIPLAHDAGLRGLCVRALCSLWQTSETDRSVTCFWHLRTALWLLASGLCLLALTALNHPQGLGIAALGVAAVGIWRVIEWKRSALWWLIGGTILVNTLFLWLYNRPAIIETYRAQGYLNAWYSFNILDLASPAGDRMMQIVSLFGLLNLAAAMVLMRRNQVIVWLTITPFTILLMPCIGLLLSNIVAMQGDAASIIIFQRMFFAIPFGLTATSLGAKRIYLPAAARFDKIQGLSGIVCVATTGLAFFALTAVSNSSSAYNRTWNSVAGIPLDLRMNHVLPAAKFPLLFGSARVKVITNFPTGTALQSVGVLNVVYACRTIGVPASSLVKPVIIAAAAEENGGSLLFIPAAIDLYTHTSLASQLSNHWPPQTVAVDLAAGPELSASAKISPADKTPLSTGTLFKLPNPTYDDQLLKKPALPPNSNTIGQPQQ